MNKALLFASIATISFIPSMANAQQSCERQRSTRVIGTVVGAGAGGLLGNAVAGRGDKTLGTVIGAVGGAILGNQITKPDGDCSRAYGFYDKDNRWHATGIDASAASGCFDRDGIWVAGAPNGYYDSENRWRANVGTQADNGAYGDRGHWVPASANGYFDRDEQWIAGSASGYYDDRGEWVPGATTGHYDSRGRWMQGVASGRTDANGRWMADTQPGYYGSDRRWRAGPAQGYYDARGRWVTTGGSQSEQRDDGDGYYDRQGRWHDAPAERSRATGYYDRDDRWVAYGNDRWMESAPGMADNDMRSAPRDVIGRTAWLDRYVRSASSQGRLSRVETNRSLRELGGIRATERAMPHNRNGELSVRNEAAIQVRLNRVSDRLRMVSSMTSRR